MKFATKITAGVLVTTLIVSLCAFRGDHSTSRLRFPWRQAGLTERQAAAHLLSRFTYGARPGDVDAVLSEGLEKWFARQLDGKLEDTALDFRLSNLDAIGLSNAAVTEKFPRQGQVLRMAVSDGVINKDSVSKADKAEYKQQLQQYMQQHGLRPERELFRQMIAQKVLRATYTNNQLREVLTDFWFNHFNVSVTKNDCALYIPAYERDVIRPNVAGKFETLLLATAKSPAMLLYLDNFSSAGTADTSAAADKMRGRLVENVLNTPADSVLKTFIKSEKAGGKNRGLNENYAREVMELHTLGVDGGYTQQDVTQAAKVLTGWTVYPFGESGKGNAVRKLIERVGEDRLAQRGFVHDGDFLFAANRHQGGNKIVLGTAFQGGGYAEGQQLLHLLAHHPSTATFICRKLAVRFVSDNPAQSLLDKMSKTYLQKDGDIGQVLLTMVSSPEFWSPAAVRSKTKSPFELAISTVRALNADVRQPNQLFNWSDMMGQKLYYYQAPTGFPDRGQYWINTGSLLTRMNFGLAVASQRIPGVSINLLALNNGHEPESAEAALSLFSRILMPERNLSQTIKRLTPLLHDPELEQKIGAATGNIDSTKNSNGKAVPSTERTAMADSSMKAKNAAAEDMVKGNMMSQVVGIIIGSPEFQRR